MATPLRAALAAVAASLLLAAPASAHLGVSVSNGLVPGALLSNPGKADFGAWPVGATSQPPVTVTFTNNDSESRITAGPDSIDGTNPDDFKIERDDCSDRTLLPGGDSCDIVLDFTPADAGGRSAVLHVPNSQGTDNQVFLTGRGTVHLAHTPDSIDFGDVPVAGQSASQTATFSNDSTGNVTITGVSTGSEEFFVTGGTCDQGTVVAPGDKCTVDVAFAPSFAGADGATLEVTSDSTGSPDDIPLSGNGTVHLSHAPNRLPFGGVPVGSAST